MRVKQALQMKQEQSKMAELFNTPAKLNSITNAILTPSDDTLPSIQHTKLTLRIRSLSETKLKLDNRTKRTSKQTRQVKQSKHSQNSREHLGHSVSNLAILSAKEQQRGKFLSKKQFTMGLISKMPVFPQQQMHQIYLSVRKGVIATNAEYRRYVVRKSNATQKIMLKLREFLLKWSSINGSVPLRSLITLAQRSKPSNYEMLRLFTNSQELIDGFRGVIPGLRYYSRGSRLVDLAATCIQSWVRMRRARKFCLRLRVLMRKIKIIQNYWRISLLRRRTKREILKARMGKIDLHLKLQQEFISSWNLIRNSPRFEIHICTWSMEEFKCLTLQGIKQRENVFLSRIFRVIETNLRVIYVTPMPIQEELLKYYEKLLGYHREKVYFLTPESRLPLEVSTTATLIYSPKALKRIKSIVGQSYAYIVPASPSSEYINLSAVLALPVYSGPMQISKVYSSKATPVFQRAAQSKRKAPFETLFRVHSIYSEKELINTLSILVFKHRDIRVWYFKIEDEVGSRGLAYLNVMKISFLREINRNGQGLQMDSQTILKLIAEEIKMKLPSKLKIMNKEVYGDYDTYLTHFLTRGGVIQATPKHEINQTPSPPQTCSVSFHIEPNGDFEITGTFDRLRCGSVISPSSFSADYSAIVRCLYKELYLGNKLFGYFTADFLTFGEGSLYALGLDCYLNEIGSSILMNKFIARATYEKETNSLIDAKNESVHYLYCPVITLNQLPALSAFFKECRYGGIEFDLERKRGTVFMLMDTLDCGKVGFMCSESSRDVLLATMKLLCDHFSGHYRRSKRATDQIGALKGVITTLKKKK